jgi:hypothetical protein
MKRPSFQFYPSDWLRDTALRTCSTGARGLWIDMICFMHEGSPYGHLKVNHKVIHPVNLASMVGATLSQVEGWLNELQEAGVYDLTNDGVIYSRRMIRDENLRNMRAAAGKLGGNPALTKHDKVNHEVESKVKQNPTPSSSSSSSSSINKKATIVASPVGVSDSVWQDFKSLRKAKKAPITQRAIDAIASEATQAGWPLEKALEECVVRGWQSFKADWIKPKVVDLAKQTVPSRQGRDPALVKIDEERKLAVPPSLEVLEKMAQLRGVK